MSKKMYFDYANTFIAVEDFKKAFKSLKLKLIDEHSKRTGNKNKLLWIDIEKVKASKNLHDLLILCQWCPEYDLDNNIDTLKSCINLLGEDELIFSALAPYIHELSLLIMYAEDEADLFKEHKYVFHNGKMFYVYSNGTQELVKYMQ